MFEMTTAEKSLVKTNEKLKRQKKILIVTVSILSLLLIYFAFQHFRQRALIRSQHQTAISAIRYEVATANSLYHLTLSYTDEDRARYLYETKAHLESAAMSIRVLTPYYNHIETGGNFYIGNGEAGDFFRAYSSLLDSWTYERPTSAALDDFKVDMEKLAEAFQVYVDVDYTTTPIEELDYSGLADMLQELYDQARSNFPYTMD